MKGEASGGAAAVVASFWNRDEKRLRALPRLALQWVLMAILTAPLVIPETYMLGLAGSVLIAARYLDRRRLRDLGLSRDRQWWTDLAFGLGLGTLLMTGIFLTEWAAGWIEITGTFQTGQPDRPFSMAILLPIFLFAAVALGEELNSRGYGIKNMSEGLHFRPLGPGTAIMLSWIATSVLFGLGHGGNPKMTTLATINLIGLGLLFGAGYVVSGRLAVPIGLHFSWNFVQGHVFGLPVSGIERYATSVIETGQTGPELWTGDAFGPEGGLLASVATLVGMILIMLWGRWRYGRFGPDPSLVRPSLRDGGAGKGLEKATVLEEWVVTTEEGSRAWAKRAGTSRRSTPQRR